MIFRNLDNYAGVPFRFILLIVIIVLLIITYFVYNTYSEPRCNPEDVVTIQGTLKGFNKENGYWNTTIDNESYMFLDFKENYMNNLLGYNILIKACYRPSDFGRKPHYNLMSAFIQEQALEE